MAKIEIRNLSKTFENKKRFRRPCDSVQALKHVSLTIPDGSFFVLMGESGSGKTTLMRILLGLESYNEGEVLFDGVQASTLSMAEKNIAFVPQNVVLYPNLTVYENIAMPLRIQKLPFAEIFEKIKNVSLLLGMDSYLTRKPRELSGGQKQRAVLARALVKEASLTFFDEPLSNIEPTLRESFIADFQKIKRGQNATYVYSTHRLEEALALADQIAILQKGEILQVGSPTDLLSKPKNEAVFSFLNSEGTFFFFLPLKNQTLTIGGSSFSFPCPDGFYDFGFPERGCCRKRRGICCKYFERIEYLGGQQKASFQGGWAAVYRGSLPQPKYSRCRRSESSCLSARTRSRYSMPKTSRRFPLTLPTIQ
jgi:multiple sugar transport system ATP-binding protein